MYIDYSRSKFRLRFKGRSLGQQSFRIPEIIFLNTVVYTCGFVKDERRDKGLK